MAIVIISFSATFNIGRTASESSISVITVDELGLVARDGETVRQVEVGQQVSIRASITNHLDTEQSFVILIEVRDGSDVTGYLAWQGGKIRANGNYTFETSWMPDKECWGNRSACNTNYQIRSFAITDFENPQVLGAVTTLGEIAVIGTTEQGNKLYRLVLDGKEYGIEYSIDSGYIKTVTFDEDLSTLSILVGNVNSDSLLTVKAPKDLLFEVFSCGIDPALENLEVNVFVDTVPRPETFELADDEWKIMLEAGAGEVEFVGVSC